MVTEGGHIHQGKHGEVLKKLGREATTGRGSWPATSTVCVCSSGGRGALESFPLCRADVITPILQGRKLRLHF